MTFSFRPAASFTERHGLFVALVGSTNTGKSYSALRLARGIAGPDGKVAVLDTEAGRTLHLKSHFDFDVRLLDPPHRPDVYYDAAVAAQEAGYGCLVIDSFTAAWRGVGGTIDWIDEELNNAVARARSNAERYNRNFDEAYTRTSQRSAASIRPKMAWKRMVFGFLGLKMPVIFAIRGEETYDPEKKEKVYKAQVNKDFLFEVTVSFRLASQRKGVVDLSDPASWKMEGDHRRIFRDGEQLSEDHGAALAAWARGEGQAPAREKEREKPGPDGWPMLAPDATLKQAPDGATWVRWCKAAIAKMPDTPDIDGWTMEMTPIFASLANFDAAAVDEVKRAAGDRRAAIIEARQP
jgi:hypothetical protein